ncbi:inorganic phosphate transporter [Candidatus Venteria ishoeyi]|uniref:Phosphate transporter n=1 Tax=Candidatus Venteria ishoeyi TaxID=1899563 RepID=A0A1H6F7S2_9GAMM|nr:inorganic phosphate transporter [Candidatus Venteria ishoeyi]MDM8547451.1 inorganic phosphate transporter [Candidatus Venteria ishoeyi]SEH06182.1 Low-affinity inorganic phosphate transporter 1 [Candidatus Venteria ishoeyi]
MFKLLSKMEDAAQSSKGDFAKFGIVIIFMIVVLILSYNSMGGLPTNAFLVIAALFGAYMAMNIGANDVANNVGPAVGSKALTLGGAIVIAGIFEAGGAFIAGGDVVGTIKKGIIDIDAFGGDADSFIWAMMAALLAAGVWLNVATKFGAPVSTTHSIVGGVMGAGIAAGGFSIVSWGTMGKIASSWVISPVLGGIIAALFLFSIKKTMVFKEDKVAAGKFWVPVYVAIMTWAFTTYLTLKGLKKIWPDIVDILVFLPDEKKPSFAIAAIFGLILAAIVYLLLSKRIAGKKDLANTRHSINALFTIPLIFAAALLSFAHGANDVANAIGPLAAISDAVSSGGIASKAAIPLWVMAVGALGIVVGLALYGPKLIKTVGSEITELDQMRAFSIAMAAAITVIIASQLGLPVSSTHIAIGGIFGVGFLREYLQDHKEVIKLEDEERKIEKEENKLEQYRDNLQELLDLPDDRKDKKVYKEIGKLYDMLEKEEKVLEEELRVRESIQKKKYVKRDAFKKIIAAWLVTVPVAAIFSASVYFMIRGMML